jgi:hypothetical protein
MVPYQVALDMRCALEAGGQHPGDGGLARAGDPGNDDHAHGSTLPVIERGPTAAIRGGSLLSAVARRYPWQSSLPVAGHCYPRQLAAIRGSSLLSMAACRYLWPPAAICGSSLLTAVARRYPWQSLLRVAARYPW